MNEKIKQLADQAGINYVTGMGYSNDEVSDLQVEEFAELIVKECGVALNLMMRDQISRGKAFDLIKQHFGINPI
jgi:hypothetical protein